MVQVARREEARQGRENAAPPPRPFSESPAGCRREGRRPMPRSAAASRRGDGAGGPGHFPSRNGPPQCTYGLSESVRPAGFCGEPSRFSTVTRSGVSRSESERPAGGGPGLKLSAVTVTVRSQRPVTVMVAFLRRSGVIVASQWRRGLSRPGTQVVSYLGASGRHGHGADSDSRRSD